MQAPSEAIFVGGGGESQREPQLLRLGYGNRHGLIAGATGTGKTITVQILAEQFSAAGVPVFLTDIKGDVAGIAMPGTEKGFLTKRAETIGLEGYTYRESPVIFWDFFGEHGHPIRATMAEVGPLLLSRMLDVTDAQEGVLNVAFRIADEQGLPILDLKDLRAMLAFMGENQRELSMQYGNVTTASIGAIQRKLLVLENQGAAHFFSEPALELSDFMRVAPDGRGYVSILHAERLMQTPQLYATFLLWLLSQLFEELPEVGNPDKPKLVFFFDEAHLLFKDAPKALLEKIERVARLIRSKGVGIYFCTQNPDDVPDVVLGQLGNRIQHALRAFTARDQQALRRAAQTYRPNPRFDIAETIRDVGVGEAVTSFLEEKGNPGIAERTLIRPPSGQMGPIEPGARQMLMLRSPVAGKYERMIDSDSAHEMLARRAEAAAREAAAALATAEAAKTRTAEERTREFTAARRYEPPSRATTPKTATRAPTARRGDTPVDAFAKSMARQLGSRTGQALVRGVLGTLLKGR
ncbi:MAG: helicase HerA-like domain-containing protein [Roseinatronobacter sp.]